MLKKILIFDSGVGGLTISQSLTEYLPMAEQILLCDNAYFPYGEMNEDELLHRVTEILVEAASNLRPDCIVLACNTVSTVALDKIRSILNIPIIGVVPAIKPAAQLSSSKVIGLLATPATVERSYTADLVSSYADDCVLISVGNTRLVVIAEQRLRGIDVKYFEIQQIVEPFVVAAKEQNLDTVVLGCTHFPLLSDILAEVLPETITLIDSSIAIARQVKAVLKVSDIEPTNTNHSEARLRCLMTKIEDDISLYRGLKNYNFDTPEYFKIHE